MINHAEKVDCGAFRSEKLWHHLWQTPFSAESKMSRCDPISPSNSQFVDGRDTVEQATMDICSTGQELLAVKAAFDAVGIH